MFGRNKTTQNQVVIKEQHKESRKERKEREQTEKEAEEQRKQQFELEEQSWALGVDYMGGHKLYPKKQRAVVHIERDGLRIEELDNLQIPYSKIKSLENMDEARITKTRVLLMGPLIGLLWKKKFLYTVIEYNDGLLDQSVILDCDKDADGIQRMIYARMLKAKQRMEQEA